MPKRGYFVWGADYAAGFAVVANSAREAKKIAFSKPELSSEYPWTEVQCRWMRHATVSDIPIGMVDDARDALLRGIYDTLMEYQCDECFLDAEVRCYRGRALCDACEEKLYGNEVGA